MLSVHEARARLLAGVKRLSSERIPLADAAGRTLAEDLVVREPLPPFDCSSMDGYAVATADAPDLPPWTLPVDGEASAGAAPAAHTRGTACRIFTGAPVPSGADAVVMQEQATRRNDMVQLEVLPKAGQHVRRAGDDLAAGAVALTKGSRLSPGALALAAMLDRPELVVARRPRVTILCTGDELRTAGEPTRPGSIAESNSAALAALARQAGASTRVAPVAPDDEDAMLRAIEEALDGTDVLITVGGASVGDHDVVRPALERAGVVLDFWRVAIKPGKPLAVGRTATSRVLGLPGNPASALVTWAVFGMPLLRARQGVAQTVPMPLRG